MSKEDEGCSHYHFRISLRFRHLEAGPSVSTQKFGVEPQWSWKAGEPRRTPKRAQIEGLYRKTYRCAVVAPGRYPTRNLNDVSFAALSQIAQHRKLLHKLRSEGRSIELFIGRFFEKQSSDVLAYGTFLMAGDLKIDVSLDVCFPTQPQVASSVEEDVLTARATHPN